MAMFKRICLSIARKMDPGMIDWAYFTVGNEWLADIIGTISSKLWDWGGATH